MTSLAQRITDFMIASRVWPRDPRDAVDVHGAIPEGVFLTPQLG